MLRRVARFLKFFAKKPISGVGEEGLKGKSAERTNRNGSGYLTIRDYSILL